MAEFLAYDDPRIHMSPAAAAIGDGATRAALRILSDALALRQDRILSAPALGIPVRVLAARRGDTIQYLLNP